MDGVSWIKLQTNIFDNNKIVAIEDMPEGDAMLVIWLKLLAVAGQCDDNGRVYLDRDIPYTEQLLATRFRKPLTIVQLALSTFVKLHMIEIVDDIICVSNWSSFKAEENSDGEELERIREQNRKRVSEYRTKQKQAKLEGQTTMDIDGCNVTCNVTCNAPSNNINNNNNNTSLSNSNDNNQVAGVAGRVVYRLQLNDGSYYDVYQNEVDELKDIYPNANVDQEFKKMVRWIKDNPKKRKTKRGIGTFISTWMDKAQNRYNPNNKSQTVGANGVRVNTEKDPILDDIIKG